MLLNLYIIIIIIFNNIILLLLYSTMSRTFKLLNASAKHVYVLCYVRFKAIIIIMYTQESVYICVNILYMQNRCIYCIFVKGLIVHISYILILPLCQSSCNTHGTKL